MFFISEVKMKEADINFVDIELEDENEEADEAENKESAEEKAQEGGAEE